MKNEKFRKWFLIGAFFVTVMAVYSPMVATQFYHEISGAPIAIDGKMDLSDCDPYHEIFMDGQWEFYWEQFIVSNPGQKLKTAYIANVPDNWSNYNIDGESLPAGGYGSFRLILNNLSYSDEIVLYIPEFGGAYRVYIDRHLVAKSGTATMNMNRIFTTPQADLYPTILSPSPTHEVVIEMATTRFSGLYIVPILCDYHQTWLEIHTCGSIRLILFGVALFAFVSLMSMYLFSFRHKIHTFWMPLLILFILIRMMLTTQFYSFWQPIVFFNMSFESTNELMYFVTFALKYLLIFLIQEHCGMVFSKKEKIGFLLYYIFLYIIYLIVPHAFYNQNLSILVPSLTFVLDIYLFIKVLRWRTRINKYGMITFVGETFIIIGLAVNSFYVNGKIYQNMSLTMMIFFTLFEVIMLWVYSRRMGDLYDDFTISASRLQIAGKLIAMQKEYFETLSRQMNEIREIKHDINHFTHVMLGLVEEGNLDRLRTFLDEYCEKSRIDQLPIFCEHTICNSIIGHYYLRAKEYGILFETHCSIANQTAMSDSDLCIILGNGLQNAVYACKQMDLSQPRFVKIEIMILKGQLLIKITNSYQGKLNIKDGRYISLKGDNSHGLGIRNMTKVMENYGGLLKIEHTESIFTLMAAVPEQ